MAEDVPIEFEKVPLTPDPPAPAPSSPIIPSNLINPSSKRRIWIILSYPLLLLIGIPWWWYTTSIQRLPLSLEELETIPRYQNLSYTFPIALTASRNAFPEDRPGRAPIIPADLIPILAREVEKDGTYKLKRAGDRDAVRGWYMDDLNIKGDDLRVHIEKFDHAENKFPLQPYISTRPHISPEKKLIEKGTLIVPVHPEKVSDPFLRNHLTTAIAKSLISLFPKMNSQSRPFRALKYAPNITLSFVLLNEDASMGAGIESWEIEEGIEAFIQPHLEPLKDIHQFNIETQILYHAPLKFEPLCVGGVGTRERECRVNQAQIKGFVNTEQWSLHSGSSNSPVLRFLLFIPSLLHQPMRLEGAESNAFLIPQFGGVYVHNPPRVAPLSVHDLASPFAYFTSHLSSLLSLPEVPIEVLEPGRGSSQPLSPFGKKQLLRARAEENLEDARETLKAIDRLVTKIKEMKVGVGVQRDVRGALDKLREATSLTRPGELAQRFNASRDAVWLANRAFFNPTMASLLYFPDEHKYAVYAPLFAPIAVPIVVASIKEIKRYLKKRKVKKE